MLYALDLRQHSINGSHVRRKVSFRGVDNMHDEGRLCNLLERRPKGGHELRWKLLRMPGAAW